MKLRLFGKGNRACSRKRQFFCLHQFRRKMQPLQRLHLFFQFPAIIQRIDIGRFLFKITVYLGTESTVHRQRLLIGFQIQGCLLYSLLNIYEHTFVKELSEHEAVTANGRIFFKRLIFATHFPIDNKHGLYFLKMYQQRSYCIALKNAAQIKGMYVDGSGKGLSFRNYGDFLLLGGGGHRTGKKGGNWQELRETAKKYYPEASEAYAWAAPFAVTASCSDSSFTKVCS